MELSVQDLEFSYRSDSPVFHSVSFKAENSGIFCILGPNGIGKSTLLKCIVRFLNPHKGKVKIDGKNIKNFSRRELAPLIAYVPQTHTPTFPFSVTDVVSMGRTAYLGHFASPGHSDIEKALFCLREVGIEHLKDRPYTELSGGERQLVMLASAIAQEPKFMLLDEPTSHLDFGNQYRLLNILKKLSMKNMGIIMTTHYPDHALSYGNQVAILNHGTLEHTGKPQEVVTPETLRELYGLNVKIIHDEHINGCLPIL